MGGPKLVERASRAGLLACDRLSVTTARARELVTAGRGGELMLLPGWWHVTSARSFLDMLTELPDILALAPRIHCPSLFLRGDSEPADLYPAEEFRRRAGGDCHVAIIENCDHFYVGREAVVAETVGSWVAKALGIGAGSQTA